MANPLRVVGLLAAVVVVSAGAVFIAGGAWLGESVPGALTRSGS